MLVKDLKRSFSILFLVFFKMTRNRGPLLEVKECSALFEYKRVCVCVRLYRRYIPSYVCLRLTEWKPL